MIDWARQFAMDTVTFNSYFGILFYWIPMIFCTVGYILKTSANYKYDLEARKKAEDEAKEKEANNEGSGDLSYVYYSPTDTIGALIGRAIITIIPVGNLMAGIFDLAPAMFGNFFHWLGKAFTQPLVPKREIHKPKRG